MLTRCPPALLQGQLYELSCSPSKMHATSWWDTGTWSVRAQLVSQPSTMPCCAAESVAVSSLSRQLLDGRRNAHVPSLELGSLQRGSLSWKGSTSTFLNANMLFSMPHAPRHFLLFACSWHFTRWWAKALFKESPGQSQKKGSAPANHGDGGQPKMLPRPLCMLTTALSSVTLNSLLEVVLLCMVWPAPEWGGGWVKWSHCPKWLY